jgi:hypothetical protein
MMRMVNLRAHQIVYRQTASAMKWTYVTDRAPKPYVHPLCTPAGACITRLEPPDHVWHRGLWFTIKYLNGENFWEEDAPYGTQVPVGTDRLEWRAPSGEVVIDEHRVLAATELADDAHALDWSSSLSAVCDVELDRTPFQGWGGYGGLTLRGRPDWHDTRLLLAGGAEPGDRVIGVRAPWCDLSGDIDGVGACGVTILDAATNPRHPVPWYGSTRSLVYGDDGWSNFLNASFLFDAPLALAAGETLRLDYRVIVHDGSWSAPRADAAYSEWQSAAQ